MTLKLIFGGAKFFGGDCACDRNSYLISSSGCTNSHVGPHSTMDGILTLHPEAPGLIPSITKIFSLELFLENSSFLMLQRLMDNAVA